MYLGVEIGGTKLQVAVCDSRGRVRELVREPVDRKRGARGILKQLEQMVPPLLSRHRVRAIGVGFGGPVDARRGRVVKSHQIKGWDGFALQSWFVRRFRLPVAIENDANVAGLAEAVAGAGRGRRAVFYITVGTGIGGGFVLDGRIYNGCRGASEIGHTRLPIDDRWPTLESVASGLAIERGTSTVAAAGRHLGVAVANLIALLNPEVIVIGGGVSLAGERFFRPLRSTVRTLVFPPFRSNYRIVPAALGEMVVAVGAALLAAREFGPRAGRRR